MSDMDSEQKARSDQESERLLRYLANHETARGMLTSGVQPGAERAAESQSPGLVRLEVALHQQGWKRTAEMDAMDAMLDRMLEERSSDVAPGHQELG